VNVSNPSTPQRALTTKSIHPETQLNASLCRTLRASLPSFDDLLNVFSQNFCWWDAFNAKISPPFVQFGESLSQFARRTYTADDAVGLAALVTAYARCTDTNNQLYQLVDQTVLSDHAYLGTIEGLSCLVLLGKSYLDIGEAKKAWLLHRRGMSMAQVMVRFPLHDQIRVHTD
jgi:hypothetical protein